MEIPQQKFREIERRMSFISAQEAIMVMVQVNHEQTFTLHRQSGPLIAHRVVIHSAATRANTDQSLNMILEN